MRSHLKHMVPCALIVVALIVLRVTGVGADSSWLPVVVLLACPVMMLSMLWGMRTPSVRPDPVDIESS